MRLKRNLVLGAMFIGLFAALNSSVAFAGTWGGEKPRWTYSDSKPKSWQLIDGRWYYFDDTNVTVTGTLALGDKIYYLSPNDGAMLENQWLQKGDDWLYYGADGAAVKNSWVSYNGKWYYLGSDFAMLKDTTTPDGYYVNHSGEFVESPSNTNNTTNTSNGTTASANTTSESNTAKASNYYSSAFNFNITYSFGYGSSETLNKPKNFGTVGSISFDVEGINSGELSITYKGDTWSDNLGSEIVTEDGSHTFEVADGTKTVYVHYENHTTDKKGTVKVTNFRFKQ